MLKTAGLIFIACLMFHFSYAHIGSPGVVMEGSAGAYKLLVSIAPPDVIPGIAKVKVFIQNSADDMVKARAIYFETGDEGSPGADLMKKVPGQRGQYEADIWLMNGGASSIQISVKGKMGKGVLVVPVVAVSSQIKEMPFATGAMLLMLAIFLFVLMVSIIGYSVSDALAGGNGPVSVQQKKYRRAGIIVAILLSSLITSGGGLWWRKVHNNYKRYMYLPLEASSKVKTVNGVNELCISLDTNSMRRSSFSFVVPDHGKLMHLFMIRIPMMDAFAHLHPVRKDSANFKTVLPDLPKGEYLLFADIVYATGFTETIRDTIRIPADLGDSTHALDQDDGYAFAPPVEPISDGQLLEGSAVITCGKPGTGARLKDGSTMIWEGTANKPLEAGKMYQLTFSVLSPDKSMAKLESYLGMPGHAAIIRNDGNVYIHLHPVGTFSMAAETNMLNRITEPRGLFAYPEPGHFRDSIDSYIRYLSGLESSKRENLLMQQMNMSESSADGEMGMVHSNRVTFPYSFPSAGNYRIWIQVKRNGNILTGAFDVVVK